MCPGLDDFARALRKRSSDAENKLWMHLKAKRLLGLKFRRQEPIGEYIVDFVCHEKKVIIELDGGQHSIDRKKDKERDRWLSGEGFNEQEKTEKEKTAGEETGGRNVRNEG